VLQVKERIATPFSIVFTFKLTFESYKKFAGASLLLFFKGTNFDHLAFFFLKIIFYLNL
jgi:hypothetical protein